LPLDGRPIAIGRLPECDVRLGGDQVSRQHAYIVPTPAGPMLVDRSRHGTRINGEEMRAPWLLAHGDVVQIGRTSLQVGLAAPVAAGPEASRGRSTRKLLGWARRYGPSEVLGTVAAVGVAVAVQRASGSTILAAYVSTVAETTVFYGIMFLRESIRDAHRAGLQGRTFGSVDLLPVLRTMVLEFGVAEALDVAVVRPLCMGLGLRWVGGAFGAFVGKVAADVAFYGPVLTMYEWRLARRHASSTLNERLRRTTANALAMPEV
jgi:hypothetical protein